MRSRESEDVHYRVELLATTLEMGLSNALCWEISLIIKQCKEGMEEQVAKEILEIVQTHQTEDKIIEALGISKERIEELRKEMD